MSNKKRILSKKNLLINKIKNSVKKFFKKWGTKSDVASVIIAAFVAYFTLKLLYLTRATTIESQNATIAAKKANDIADSALKDNRSKDAFEKERQHRQDSSDSIKENNYRKYIESSLCTFKELAAASQKQADASKRALDIAKQNLDSSNVNYKKSLDLARQELEDTKKRFELENRSFLDIRDVKLDISDSTGELTLFVDFANIGKNAAKLLTLTGTIDLFLRKPDKQMVDNTDFDKSGTAQTLNTFATQQQSKIRAINLGQLAVNDAKAVLKGEKFLLLCMIVKYKDIVLNETKYYKVKVNIIYKPFRGYDIKFEDTTNYE